MSPSRKPLVLRIARWTLIVLVVALIGIQLVPVDRSNPPVVSEVDAPPEIAEILRRACYDCHSHETVWPWYSYVAPVSWWVADHVEHARSDLNFSDWPTYDFEDLEHTMEEIGEEVEEGEMPLASYVRMHSEARLTDEERRLLVDWAEGR